MSQLHDISTGDDGALHIKIRKSDGGWHRTSIPPGHPTDVQMAVVNAHLQQLGCTPLGGGDLRKVEAATRAKHTPAVVEAFKRRMEDR